MNDSGVFDPRTIKRPDERLLKYYLLISVFTLVAFPIVFLPLFFKYETLRYTFDDEGVAMSWGLLFRKEIYLTYRRIQDIHVTRNLFQRWFGLADVAVQTAGGSGVEMTIEGIREYDRLRDFLYSKMRGAHGDPDHEPPQHASRVGTPAQTGDDVTELLREIRDSLRALNERAGGRGDRP
jgi:uncharacterized membrane protein YdbT with pleckstrin-like domain